jgi:predicted GNAT family acetyltransferase
MNEQAPNPVIDDAAKRRFELTENGFTAFADYRRQGDGVLAIPHVEAPVEMRGGGAAGRLMAGIVAHARAEGFRIIPSCPYASAWFQRHPEEADLLA